MSQARPGVLDHILRKSRFALRQYWYSPWLYIARGAYAACMPRQPPDLCDPHWGELPADSTRARIVCISDTHNRHTFLPPLPPGDVLIHAGDLTETGTEEEVKSALAWLAAAPHPHKIVVAGNHDAALAPPAARAALLAPFPSLTYLQDSMATLQIRGRILCVFGSPHTPKRGCGSFHYYAGRGQWAIPPHTDVLVTHGPPVGHLDTAPAGHRRAGGCRQLLHAVWQARPRLHVFGHTHAGRGVRYANWSRAQRAYERIVMGRRPSRNALWLLGVALFTKVIGKARFRGGEDTILVNASSLGGLGDALHQEAIVVDIELPDR